MIDNNLFKDDKASYEYFIRTMVTKLFIETKNTLNYQIRLTFDLTKTALQDQFRKLRNHFDTN
jgi:hypothetical protein